MSDAKRYEFHGEDERRMQFGMEYVAADDYDALAARLVETQRLDSVIVKDLSARIDTLEAALRKIEKFSRGLDPDDNARQCGHYVASVASTALGMPK